MFGSVFLIQYEVILSRELHIVVFEKNTQRLGSGETLSRESWNRSQYLRLQILKLKIKILKGLKGQ